MMEGDDCMEFFIHETDLIRYYKDFKIKTLSDDLENGESSNNILRTLAPLGFYEPLKTSLAPFKIHGSW
jgi:hypothetical protein